MKKLILAAMVLCFFGVSCNTGETKKEETVPGSDTTSTAISTANTDTAMATMPDSATMMKNWAAYMTPGDQHKMIASWDGTWNGEVTMWQMPGAPPEISKSTTTNKTMMGGRYQVGNHKGFMMGQPFEGMSTLAYDNARNKFVNTWIDNMGTGLMVLEGTWDDASKSITFTGNTVDPSAGNGKQMPIKEIYKVVDEKNHLLEMYGPGLDGKEFKMMEIKYSRK